MKIKHGFEGERFIIVPYQFIVSMARNPLCIVSIVIYALHDSLPVSDALPYLIGGAAGGVLAGLLFRKMPARALHLILGGVILAGGIRLIVC